jgi:Protein of unknown function (DUF1236)
VSGPKQFLEDNMTTLKSVAIVAALLAGGTSLAIAQTGQTPATGNQTSPAPFATKHQCVGIRDGLTECRTIQMSANSKSASNTAASQPTALHGSDTVILSAAQRRVVWNDLSKQAANQNAAGFNPTIGTFVPNTVKIEPMPSKVAATNPSLRPYDFAMVDHKLVIVDPSNKVIADVLSK